MTDPSTSLASNTLQPIPSTDRIAVLDIIRGFALLGIFLMNIEFFNRSFQSIISGLEAAQGLDYLAGWLIYVFVQGKFWVLFSLLFGMGFVVMRDRAMVAGRSFVAPYVRRTMALALFGLAHIYLLWVGDILLLYAISAMFLLAFFQLRGHALWLIGLFLYYAVVILAIGGGFALTVMPADILSEINQKMQKDVDSGLTAASVYASGNFFEITTQRHRDYWGYMFDQAITAQSVMALGVFLLGNALISTGRIQQPRQHRQFFSLLLIGGLVLAVAFIGLSLSVGTSFPDNDQIGKAILASGLMLAGNLPLAMAYFSILVLICSSDIGIRMLSFLAPAGRMALTNYLLQSLLCSLIFYGYGAGLYGQIGRAGQVAIVFVTFAAQLILSYWWLQRFTFGPLEWVWRAVTYQKFSPLRRQIPIT